jgi:hypothetical protein
MADENPLLFRFTVTGPAVIDEITAFLETYWAQSLEKDEPLTVEIAAWDAPASDEAIKFYFAAVVRQIAEQAWVPNDAGIRRQYAVKEWHETLKDMFGLRRDRPFGPSVPISILEYKRKELTKYIRECESWAAGPPLNIRFIDRSEPPPWLGHKH